MSILIKNVRVLVKAGGVPEQGDILVNGDKISAIGNFSGKKTDETIDGQGMFCAPGFIDTHNDSDHYLSIFDDPGQEDFIRQGVTTIIGGNAGSSLAPLIYGSLEAMRKWADVDRMNVNWHSVGELFAVFKKIPLGVNFGTLIGHSTIRRALIGESRRPLTKNEMAVFAETLKRGLAEGGLGFSVGLNYIHARETPYSELKFFADIVKSFDGVYGIQLRRLGNEIEISVDEAIKLAQESGVRALINDFLPVCVTEAAYLKCLEKINNLSPETDLHFDINSSTKLISPLYAFLPLWAQNGNLDVMMENLRDEWMRPRILQDMPALNPAKMVVAQSFYNSSLVGSSLKDLMSLYGLASPKEALYKLMLATGLRAIVFYDNLNLDLIREAISSPRALIGTGAAAFKADHLRKSLTSEQATSTFTRLLSEGENLISLPDAVEKITRQAARKFGISRRGEIKEGNFADLTCFSFSAKKETQINFVLVNGRIALRDGVPTGNAGGMVLDHHV